MLAFQNKTWSLNHQYCPSLSTKITLGRLIFVNSFTKKNKRKSLKESTTVKETTEMLHQTFLKTKINQQILTKQQELCFPKAIASTIYFGL